MEVQAVTHQSNQGLAGLFKAAGDPLRLQILRVLSQDSFGVLELADLFSMPQPGMSHHLKLLAKAGLLEARRQGNSIFYRRPIIKERDSLLSEVYASVDHLTLPSEIQKKVEAIYKMRAKRSQEYFRKNADKFSERQGKLCEVSQYLPQLLELLKLPKIEKKAKVLEVGPGQGLLLKELRKQFKNITALDASKEMLAQASEVAKDIHYVHSALEDHHPKTSYDLVILNMVLHHLSEPSNSFAHLAKLLKKDQYLLIADLCPHDQVWARDYCGDVWLGFEPKDLETWGALAGLYPVQSQYLGLKNGFQIQLKLFQKLESIK